MAVVAPAAAPTRADADRAAAALIDAGASKVLLFGSVARGTAGPHSDIDLVAIFADLDYAERHVRQRSLQEAAAAAAPWPVQVHVTDRPEWWARVKYVATSFEHRVAGEAILVAVAPSEGPVYWGKEMVLPMSDPVEALRQFADWVLPRLDDLANAASQSLDEVDLHLPADERALARLNRLVRVCTAAAIAAETSLKALAVLYHTPTPTEKDLQRAGHDVGAVLDLVPQPAHGAAATVFDRLGIDLKVLSAWRWRSTYADDIEALRVDAERLAEAYAVMAPEIAGVLADHLQYQIGPRDSTVADAVARRARYAARIAAQDVRLGRPATPGLDV